MAVKEKEIYTLGIAILGNFNPVIFTPHWLASKEIIRNSEADSAKVDIIHPEISRFDLDWLSIEVTQSRVDFKTRRESEFVAMRDLVVSAFTILKETPIQAIGINHLAHYSLRDFKEYERFGYALSPVQEFADILNIPKLQTIQFVETESENPDEGIVRLTISPSDLISDKKSVVFNCNHHFSNKNGQDTKKFIEILTDRWEYSFSKSNQLYQALWERLRY